MALAGILAAATICTSSSPRAAGSQLSAARVLAGTHLVDRADDGGDDPPVLGDKAGAGQAREFDQSRIPHPVGERLDGPQGDGELVWRRADADACLRLRNVGIEDRNKADHAGAGHAYHQGVALGWHQPVVEETFNLEELDPRTVREKLQDLLKSRAESIGSNPGAVDVVRGNRANLAARGSDDAARQAGVIRRLCGISRAAAAAERRDKGDEDEGPKRGDHERK